MKKVLLFLLLPLTLLAESTLFVDLDEIVPGQTRIAVKRVQNIAAKMDQPAVVLPDGRRSAFTADKAFQVVHAPFGYLLIDGHHHAMASVIAGFDCLPIHVVADRHLVDEATFWREAEANGWAYLRDCNGAYAVPPRSFHQLEDDPNRYFASLIAWKVPKGEDWTAYPVPKNAVWTKVGKDIPFIEFRIAETLWKHGVVYHYEMGDEPPSQLVEQARDVLCQFPIDGLRVQPGNERLLPPLG